MESWRGRAFCGGNLGSAQPCSEGEGRQQRLSCSTWAVTMPGAVLSSLVAPRSSSRAPSQAASLLPLSAPQRCLQVSPAEQPRSAPQPWWLSESWDLESRAELLKDAVCKSGQLNISLFGARWVVPFCPGRCYSCKMQPVNNPASF